MKIRAAILSTGIILGLVSSSQATIYGDSIGENFTGAGGGILDITSVEVNNTANDLVFKINLAGDPTAPTDWGKYMIAIDSAPGGDSAGNGWGRPISMPGMDYWIGSWVDSGNGVQLQQFTGAWAQIGAAGAFAGGPPMLGLGITKDASSLTITLPLAGLGLAPGNSFFFDVFTSGGGGGDSAVDSLANPGQSINDWGVPYNTGSLVLPYNIVPEPSTVALMGIGFLALIQRTIRRK